MLAVIEGLGKRLILPTLCVYTVCPKTLRFFFNPLYPTETRENEWYAAQLRVSVITIQGLFLQAKEN